ncbi:MAG: hypothetical protein KME60_26225 [Cyanomargarita calcarea GSE-NOS-MK-12-04C]|jgi:photosystem II stability/assembly factor-like uncharacterized protein|uniref:Baseplate protein J-like domain-containing protein n=1 Tax=Cyanomargarita calcarea GSE-NOS-MK-12-04C TaxID=2839659 RepID=A0A951QU12_9CYAN|nr:hypothetical protein [Cyanomargarita calcarea GSE-NOS-MK-12-04C]
MNEERLYNLLPAIYRIRDESQGSTLRALLNVIENELQIVESDIDNLYDNWFIETCDEWVVPYIGDLLAVNLYAEKSRTYGQERRAYIANTLAYRARKGTAPVLEQLVVDITGWRSRVVEFFKLLSTTQNLNHLRPTNGFVDLRRSSQAERLGTPFEQAAAYTVQLGNVNNQSGKYNIPNIGIFVWRLKSYPIERGTAFLIKSADPKTQGRCYTFNPLGDDIPLFNQPQTETEITSLADENNVPAPLRREALNSDYLNLNPVLQVFLNGQPKPILPEKILFRNLNKWEIPANNEQNGKTYQVIVDPEKGRLAFLTETVPESVEVSYSYGFNGDIGGGPYDRSESIASITPSSISRIKWDVEEAGERGRQGEGGTRRTLQNSLSSHPPIPPSSSLHTAVQKWNKNVQIWEYCQEQIYIQLQRLSINADGEISAIALSDTNLRPKFQAGIVNGLKVIAKPGESDVIVSSGTAVDSQGRRIDLGINYRVSLGNYRSQTVILAISYQAASEEPRWEIQILPSPSPSSTSLASLTTDSLGRVREFETNISPSFQPGVINGLEVSVTNSSKPEVKITSGKAVNSKAKLIQLKEGNYPLSISSKEAQNWILYITPKGKIDVVLDVETGVINLKDNHTYKGNFTVKIPADKKLQIIAANEHRPHLRGNLAIQGTAKNNTDPGEFSLNGLLVEGKVTVLSGNLKKLHIAHCTLVPDKGGLTVEQPEREIETEEEEDNAFSLFAVVMYFLSLIQKIIKLGIPLDNSNSQKNLTKLFQLAFQQITRVFSFLKDVTRQWQCPELPSENNLFEEICEPLFLEEINFLEKNNTKLNVIIDSSICGTIRLADTVPKLTITDSIIDKGSSKGNQVAIASPGSSVNINTTTLFGRTSVSILEASNSIFNEKVTVLRQQDGCVRFSYLQYGSKTPHRYFCQPDKALETKVNLPKEITAIAINTNTGHMFAGSAGNGVFCYLNDENDENDKWTSVNNNLTNLNITALITYTKPEIKNSINYLFAGTTEGGIFRSTDNGENWVQSNNISKNTDFIPLVSTNVTDFIAYEKSLPGTISSDDITVTGNATAFTKELTKDSIIIAAGETRTVTEIIDDTAIKINVPFSTNLPAETTFKSHYLLAGTASGVFISQNNGNNWKSVNVGLTNRNVTALVVSKEGEIFAGTSNGIFRSKNNGLSWNSVNRNLPNRNITALAVNPNNGEIFIGTGDGVFRSHNNFQKWKQLKAGLTDTDITAVVTYAKRGTSTIKSDGTKVTGIGTGTIKSEGTKVTGIDTLFKGELAKGSVITVVIENRVETRKVIDRDLTDTTLIIDAEFSEDLISEIDFTINYLLAGTVGGNIFLSKDNGNSWESVTTSLSITAITALAINYNNQNSNNPNLFAGTTAGSVLCSTENAKNWLPMNNGFENINEKILILTSHKPIFTSEKYGEPGYAQLSQVCGKEIRTGAEDGSEMGVFNSLKQPQREANLRASLKEYLRFGLEAGIFYET